MKATVNAALHMELHQVWEEDTLREVWQPAVWRTKIVDAHDRIFLREIEVEVDIPDDWDPTASQIAALEREKVAALDAYQRAVAEINERLSKLQALTNGVTP